MSANEKADLQNSSPRVGYVPIGGLGELVKYNRQGQDYLRCHPVPLLPFRFGQETCTKADP